MPGFGLPPSAYEKSKGKYPDCKKDCYVIKKFGTKVCNQVCRDKIKGCKNGHRKRV